MLMLAMTEWLDVAGQAFVKYGAGAIFFLLFIALLVYVLRTHRSDRSELLTGMESLTKALDHAARALEEGNRERREDRKWATDEVVKVNREISELRGRVDGGADRRR